MSGIGHSNKKVTNPEGSRSVSRACRDHADTVEMVGGSCMRRMYAGPEIVLNYLLDIKYKGKGNKDQLHMSGFSR